MGYSQRVRHPFLRGHLEVRVLLFQMPNFVTKIIQGIANGSGHILSYASDISEKMSTPNNDLALKLHYWASVAIDNPNQTTTLVIIGVSALCLGVYKAVNYY